MTVFNLNFLQNFSDIKATHNVHAKLWCCYLKYCSKSITIRNFKSFADNTSLTCMRWHSFLSIEWILIDLIVHLIFGIRYSMVVDRRCLNYYWQLVDIFNEIIEYINLWYLIFMFICTHENWSFNLLFIVKLKI